MPLQAEFSARHTLGVSHNTVLLQSSGSVLMKSLFLKGAEHELCRFVFTNSFLSLPYSFVFDFSFFLNSSSQTLLSLFHFSITSASCVPQFSAAPTNSFCLDVTHKHTLPYPSPSLSTSPHIIPMDGVQK